MSHAPTALVNFFEVSFVCVAHVGASSICAPRDFRKLYVPAS